jgi:hypothetical protein
MERLLLVWDEIDDLVGVGLCVASRAMMRMNTPMTRAGGVATLLLAGALLVTQKSLFQLW